MQQAASCQLVHVYLLDDATTRLLPTGWFHPTPPPRFARATNDSAFELGEGLPGRVAAAGEPAWIVDIAHDDNFPRASEALACGFRAAFDFPVVTEGRTVAVIELFHDEPGMPDTVLLDVMLTVGTQLGRVFERQQALDELHSVVADREAIVAIVGSQDDSETPVRRQPRFVSGPVHPHFGPPSPRRPPR